MQKENEDADEAVRWTERKGGRVERLDHPEPLRVSEGDGLGGRFREGVRLIAVKYSPE